MTKITITDTFFIDGDSKNPLAVKATLTAEYEYPAGWEWEVIRLHSVELMVGDKEGIDITKQVLSSARKTALITAQVANMEEKIFEALADHEPVS